MRETAILPCIAHERLKRLKNSWELLCFATSSLLVLVESKGGSGPRGPPFPPSPPAPPQTPPGFIAVCSRATVATFRGLLSFDCEQVLGDYLLGVNNTDDSDADCPCLASLR